MEINEEYEDMLPEEFSSLKECVTYYGDVLSIINKSHDLGLYSKKEFKAIKKFIIKQQDKSLKLIKKLDTHQREKEESKLKPVKPKQAKETKPQLTSTEKNKAIEQKPKQYQIEDKDGNKIDGQMDIKDIQKE